MSQLRRRSRFLLLVTAALVAPLLVSGCLRNPSINDLSRADRSRLAGLQQVDVSDLSPAHYQILETVHGISCQVTTFEGPPTYQEAMDGLRRRAAQAGADAVANVACERTGLSWSNNCADSIECIGEAIALSEQITPRDHPGNASPAALGTGWFLRNGLVVTNEHVVRGRSRISLVLPSREAVPARVIAADARNDLVLLETDGGFERPNGILLSQEPTDPGAEVWTIGHPHSNFMGPEPKVTSGIISAATGLGGDPRFLQTTVSIQPGNSGGPLLDMRGVAVGVATKKLDARAVFEMTGDLPEGVSYAIKAIYVRALVESTGRRSAATSHEPVNPSLADVVKRVRGSVVGIVAQ